MVSHKPPAYGFGGSCLLTICLLILATALPGGPAQVAPPPQAADGSNQEPSGSNERLHDLLAERCRLLKDIRESLQLYLQAGRADLSDVVSATVTMYRAEADLCTTAAERVKVYRKLVAALQPYENDAARRAAAGRMTEAQAMDVKVATIEAQIDLERQRLARQTSL